MSPICVTPAAPQETAIALNLPLGAADALVNLLHRESGTLPASLLAAIQPLRAAVNTAVDTLLDDLGAPLQPVAA